MTGWLPALLVFFAIAAITVVIALGMEMLAQARLRRRAVKHLQEMDDSFFGGGGPDDLIRRAREGRITQLESLLLSMPRVSGLTLLLERANVSLTIQTFALLTLGIGAAAGLTTLIATGSLLFSALAAALLTPLPYAYVRYRKWRRVSDFERQFPEAIDLMGRAIRAGHPLSSGIRMVAEEMPEPLGGEFRRMFEEQRFGLPFNDALLSLADRNELVDVRIFVTAVLIQREVGGNLAEILDKLSKMIRMRFSIRRQLRTYTAQGRVSGYILAVIPIAVGFIIFVLNPGYMMTLFTEPLGRYMIAGAIVLQLLGFMWIRKIVNIEI